MKGWPHLAMLLPLIGCGMPSTPSTGDAPRDGVARRTYAVPDADIVVSALEKGDPRGQRVIFVHGTPGSADGWERFVRAPPPHIDLIAIDRPGFGATRPNRALPSLRAQAAAIAPLLVRRNGRWPILVGHSLGGPLIAQVALDYPGKVEALMILAGSFDPALEHVYRVQPMGEWPVIRSVLPQSLRNANIELMALKPELVALAPRLSGLRCRVLVVHGTRDANVPYANVAFLRGHVPATLLAARTLAGRNHFIPWSEQPLIAGLLDGLIARGSTPC